MTIPGHDLVFVRKSDDPSSPDFRLMRGDCTCGRRGCVYFRTTEDVERSYSHHVWNIAAIAMQALNEIEGRALDADDDRNPFVQYIVGRVIEARRDARR